MRNGVSREKGKPVAIGERLAEKIGVGIGTVQVPWFLISSRFLPAPARVLLPTSCHAENMPLIFFSSPPLVFPVLSVPSLFLTKTVLNGVKRSSVLQDAISFLFSFSVSIFLSVLCFHLLAVGHGEQGRFLKSCRSSG